MLEEVLPGDAEVLARAGHDLLRPLFHLGGADALCQARAVAPACHHQVPLPGDLLHRSGRELDAPVPRFLHEPVFERRFRDRLLPTLFVSLHVGCDFRSGSRYMLLPRAPVRQETNDPGGHIVPRLLERNGPSFLEPEDVEAILRLHDLADLPFLEAVRRLPEFRHPGALSSGCEKTVTFGSSGLLGELGGEPREGLPLPGSGQGLLRTGPCLPASCLRKAAFREKEDVSHDELVLGGLSVLRLEHRVVHVRSFQPDLVFEALHQPFPGAALPVCTSEGVRLIPSDRQGEGRERREVGPPLPGEAEELVLLKAHVTYDERSLALAAAGQDGQEQASRGEPEGPSTARHPRRIGEWAQVIGHVPSVWVLAESVQLPIFRRKPLLCCPLDQAVAVGWFENLPCAPSVPHPGAYMPSLPPSVPTTWRGPSPLLVGPSSFLGVLACVLVIGASTAQAQSFERGGAGTIGPDATMLLPFGLWPPAPVRTDPDTLPMSERVRSRIEVAGATGRMTASSARIHSTEVLPAFYERRAFAPAWFNGAALTEEAVQLIEALRRSEEEEGLPGYHQEEIESLLGRLEDGAADDAALRVDLELLLTNAFLVLGSHLHLGRVNPETRQAEWQASRGELDLAESLEEALSEDGVEPALERLRPPHSGYGALKGALAELHQIADRGGWGTVPQGGRLEQGSEGERVAALRARLRVEPDPSEAASAASAGEAEVFDEALDAVVRRFQERHGLDADGIVGPRTLQALNVSVEERVRQVQVNLERWRWLPDDLGRNHILVNIADFSVDVVEEGERVRRMRAVVGRAYRQTPAFSDSMTYLVLAPYWHVPPGIAVNDQLPRIRNDPSGYLPSQNMVLLEQGTNRVVDPASVDWNGITAAEFNRRYRIRQEPGSTNALGRVKFMFPNRHNVYLHDSPARELFDHTVRDFSSGCVRVEGALELTEYLLRDDPRWDRAGIERAATGSAERTVWLREPVPIHLQYWTAWVDEDGALQIRNDIYNRDGRVLRALTAATPER